MTRLRFNLTQLMATVFCLGFAFGALRNADYFWACATFTLAFITVSAALVGAIARKGQARMIWSGFAVFGWACLFVGLFPMQPGVTGFGPFPLFTPPLPILAASHLLSMYFGKNNNDYAFFMSVCHSLEIIMFGIFGAFLGRLLFVKDERPLP